ncbi:MAG: hypothetical protein K8F52_19120 [Candidatus Scalindua rubra]|uniref:Cytochrome c n=1 Tax=Candidatus Scalindua brodae TaxID=237368 RepID=A0A0B0EQU5_9BACT|nr:MAG: hypothetical protein SCABRO_01208 [Candidatus Scalindua brodae]MBZ0110771.1 hypothetical protein [Candidatus Scalindua rubra]TWU30751.1 hypothetical protein S225a_24080 [Candidatus Brocadiaceae bacterium S225]
MRNLLITVITILGVSLSITSCKKSEEVNVEKVENIQNEYLTDFRLVREMKKAATAMKRLGRGVKDNDWMEIDIWTHEIKEGIGDKCVELYRAENKEVPSEFIAARDKFVRAVDNLILCSKNHDDSNSKRDYDMLKESCDDCHVIFKKELEGELKVNNLTNTSPTTR